MNHIYKIQGLDCANCARELEEKLAKINGISNVILNFMSAKLMFTIDDDSKLSIVEDTIANFEDGLSFKKLK